CRRGASSTHPRCRGPIRGTGPPAPLPRGRRGAHMILAHLFPAAALHVRADQADLLPQRLEAVPFECHALDRRRVVAAPVEVDGAVLVLEEVGVPEGEGTRRDFGEVLRERIRAAVEGTGIVLPRG